jgi:Cu(I)/Ag(I) efflux system membrane protein CusA/SilA
VGAIIGMRVREDPKTVIQAVKRAWPTWPRRWPREQLTAVPFYDRSQLIYETTATLTSTLRGGLHHGARRGGLPAARARQPRGGDQPAAGHALRFSSCTCLASSANIMSLAGIAIAIGVMVDFGIIMTENITQHLVDLQEKCRRENRRAMPVSPFNDEIIETVVRRPGGDPPAGHLGRHHRHRIPAHLRADRPGRAGSSSRWPSPSRSPSAARYSSARCWCRCSAACCCRRGRSASPSCWRSRASHPASPSAGSSRRLVVAAGSRRWALTVPGWLFAPFSRPVRRSAVWRIGREKLVNYEENPVSHGIHVAYEWAYLRIQRHKVAFTVIAIADGGLGGYLLGAGWTPLSWPLRKAFDLAGGDFTHPRLDHALAKASPASAPVSCRRSTKAACSSCRPCPPRGAWAKRCA